MHILIATPAFPPFVGGGERHTGTLAKCLLKKGQVVTVLTSTALQEPDFWLGRGDSIEVEMPEPGLTIIRMPILPHSGGFRGLLAWRKSMVMLSGIPGTRGMLESMASRVPPLSELNEALAFLAYIDGPVDIVHGFNISWERAMVAGWNYARQKGLPFVASPLAHLGEGPADRVSLNSTMRHQKYILSTADLLLTNTSIEAEGLQSRGVRPKKASVAGPGVDLPKSVAPFPESALAMKPYALFVGRTSYDKGAVHAVQAVLHARTKGSQIQLVLIGRVTPEFSKFYDALSDVEKRSIHVLGFVEESLKHAYLKEAEVLLLPSRSDSFGIVLLESWLYGRPVIAANAGGIPGVVDNGKNGILVPFGDIHSLANAIRLLSENRDLNHILGENGLQKLRANYTWEVVTDKVLEAYQEVLEGRTDNGPRY